MFQINHETFTTKINNRNVFILNSNFSKQIDSCTMGGPLSVIFSDICMTKIEVVKLTNLKFHKRFGDVD